MLRIRPPCSPAYSAVASSKAAGNWSTSGTGEKTGRPGLWKTAAWAFIGSSLRVNDRLELNHRSQAGMEPSARHHRSRRHGPRHRWGHDRPAGPKPRRRTTARRPPGRQSRRRALAGSAPAPRGPRPGPPARAEARPGTLGFRPKGGTGGGPLGQAADQSVRRCQTERQVSARGAKASGRSRLAAP